MDTGRGFQRVFENFSIVKTQIYRKLFHPDLRVFILDIAQRDVRWLVVRLEEENECMSIF
jgi:hypothetical protein